MTRGAFEVDEPDGERWQLALDLLAGGESSVSIGRLLLRRDTVGPEATGLVHIDIRSTRSPAFITRESAAADVTVGLEQFDVLSEDERLASLVRECGVAREFIYDYDNGSILLASVSANHSIGWDPAYRPAE